MTTPATRRVCRGRRPHPRADTARRPQACWRAALAATRAGCLARVCPTRPVCPRATGRALPQVERVPIALVDALLRGAEAERQPVQPYRLEAFPICEPETLKFGDSQRGGAEDVVERERKDRTSLAREALGPTARHQIRAES
eukprot:3089807-Prymnesium_polylepis.1